MQDEMIVALYWQRDEKAISETERKYGRYLSRAAYAVLLRRRACRPAAFLAVWGRQ